MATQTYEMPKFEMPKFEMPQLKGLDAETVMAVQRRNIDAMQNAGQILADGARTVAQRQSEMVQARMSEMSAQAETMMRPDAYKAGEFTAPIEQAKTSYERMLTDARELMEIMTKAQTDAMQVVNQCVLANLEEMKKLTA